MEKNDLVRLNQSIPFDKCGNVYAMTTIILSNAANQLNNLERQAKETHLLEPLCDLQTEILLSLEKFQKHYKSEGNSK